MSGEFQWSPMKGKPYSFLVHSSLYQSLGALFITYMSLILLQVPLRWEPLLIPFCGTFFLYNVNRWTDRKEDRINHPARAEFIHRYGKPILYLSIILYVLSLLLALSNSIVTLIVTAVPFILVFMYSVFRLKKLFLIKNIIVGAGWGMIPFIVFSFYSQSIMNPATLALFLFIFIRVVMGASMFDLKDVTGDTAFDIATIPGRYGTGALIISSLFLNTLAGAVLVGAFLTAALPLSAIFVSLITLYSYLVIYLMNRIETKFLCEVLVDGDGILMGLLAIISLIVV